MASSESHRQTVAPEIDATMPRSTASRATSCVLQRLKGTPLVAGSSQASAFTSILASGGKEGWSAGAGSVFQSTQPLLVKALAPLTRRLGSGVQPGSDFLVGGSLGGQQHDPGARHLPVGSGVSSGSLLQDGVLIFGRFDAEWTLAGHVSSPFSAMRHHQDLTAKGERIKEIQSKSTKVEMVRSIGADHVIDYTREDFAEGEERYDLILDIGGNSSLARLRRTLTSQGTLVIIGGEGGGRWLGGTDRQLRAMMLSRFVGQKLGTFI